MCGYWGQVNLVENTWHSCRRASIRNELDHDYILRRPFWHCPPCYLPYFGPPPSSVNKQHESAETIHVLSVFSNLIFSKL